MLKCIQVVGTYKNANSKQTINSHSLEKLFVAFCEFLCCSDNRDLKSFIKKKTAKVQRVLLLAGQ